MRADRATAVTIAGAALVPFVLLAIYLLFLWPKPAGAPPALQLIPSVICLAAGIPFVRRLVVPGAMMITKITVYAAYLVAGLGLMYLESLWVLCVGRGVCL